MMQKLINLLNWSTRTSQNNTPKKLVLSLPTKTGQAPANDNAPTRPTYRIGKRKPSDVQKAIDLSG
jgi:hypothetical protein